MHLQEAYVFSEFSAQMVVDSSEVFMSLFCLQVEKALLPEPVLIYHDQTGVSGAQDDYKDAVSLCREEIGRAKAQEEFNLSATINDSKRCVYKYISHVQLVTGNKCCSSGLSVGASTVQHLR